MTSTIFTTVQVSLTTVGSLSTSGLQQAAQQATVRHCAAALAAMLHVAATERPEAVWSCGDTAPGQARLNMVMVYDALGCRVLSAGLAIGHVADALCQYLSRCWHSPGMRTFAALGSGQATACASALPCSSVLRQRLAALRAALSRQNIRCRLQRRRHG